ncbi:MAG TPA: hybrid sensor histidine kinase/response regulator [Labilithrix sp.]
MSAPESNDALLERILVLVRGARDAQVTSDLLARAGIQGFACANVDELCARMEEGAAAALLAEEVLSREAYARLADLLARQPPWSDFPIIVIGAPTGSIDVPRRLGNLTFLERPVRVRSMLAAVSSAIRSRRRQYEARHAIESRDRFLAMLGHELRNPLGAIRLAVAAVDARSKGAPRGRELDIIDRQSKHLARLVDDLLDVARITHGKVVLARARLDLVDAVRDAFESQEARAREHGVSYVYRACASRLWVDGDRQRLEQVFANLLTNAIKYTPRGGVITVSVEREADRGVMSVTDTGVGITPDMIGRVFDVFAQSNRSLDRTEGGIGLGLAVVRSIVSLHGGTVRAESGGPGRGSSFTVELPLTTAAQPPAPSTRALAADGDEARRIVVIEDSPDIRELLVTLLELAGHEVTIAEDGPQGLACILASDPDVAFVDLGLPGFDGLEVARRARAAGSTARLVAVTGYGQSQDRKLAIEAGFDAHLTKPVGDQDLRRAMHDVAPSSA